MTEEDESGEDFLLLPRLDIICCAFGAAILLGVVLSVIRQQPPVELTQRNFIRIDLAADPVNGSLALLNIRVTTPDGVQHDLPLESVTSGSRRGRNQGLDRLRALEQSGRLHVAGLSYFGEAVTSNSSGLVGSLVIEAPAGGRWQFALRWIGLSGAAYLADIPENVAVRVRVSSNLDPNAVPQNTTIQAGVATPIGPSGGVEIRSSP